MVAHALASTLRLIECLYPALEDVCDIHLTLIREGLLIDSWVLCTGN
jgi:hypothetical protein